MNKLGQILTELGWISSEDVQRALKCQAVLGGRIGTCLLEMELIDEDQLLRSLSHQLGVDHARVQDLKVVPEQVHGLFSPKTAIKTQAIPFRMLGSEVHVALLGVHDLQIEDEIAFATGKKPRLFIANEARVIEALHRFYGQPCPDRIRQLLDRLDRAYFGSLDVTSESGNVTAPISLGTTNERINGTRTLHGDLPDLDAKRDTQPLAAEGPRSATTPPFASATTEEQVAAELLSSLEPMFDRVALFVVRRDTVQGWRGEGIDLCEKSLADFELSLERPSVFRDLAHGGVAHVGVLSAEASHAELAEVWLEGSHPSCVVAPVRVAGRLVVAAYCNHKGRPVARSEAQSLIELTAAAGRALESQIRARKLGAAPASSTTTKDFDVLHVTAEAHNDPDSTLEITATS